LLKNSWSAPQPPSAAKAVAENKVVIAAVNRCATQKQEQNRVFQHSVKPAFFQALSGTAGAVPYPKPIYETGPRTVLLVPGRRAPVSAVPSCDEVFASMMAAGVATPVSEIPPNPKRNLDHGF
jgi:hypothetical protein